MTRPARDLLPAPLLEAFGSQSLTVVLGPRVPNLCGDDLDGQVRARLIAELAPRTGRHLDGASTPRLAELYESEFGRTTLIRLYKDTAAQGGVQDNRLYELIASLAPRCTVTVSYGAALEQAFRSAGRDFGCVKTDTDIAFWDETSPQLVYLFGSLDAPEHTALTESERHSLPLRRPLLSSKIGDLAASHALLFVGFRAQDDTLESLLSIAHHYFGALRKPAYIVLADYDDLTMHMYARRNVKVLPASDEDELDEIIATLTALRTTPRLERVKERASPLLEESQSMLLAMGWRVRGMRSLDVRSTELDLVHTPTLEPCTVHIVEGELSVADVQRLQQALPPDERGVAIADSRVSGSAELLALQIPELEVHSLRTLFNKVFDADPYLFEVVNDYATSAIAAQFVSLQCEKPRRGRDQRDTPSDVYWGDDYIDSWLHERTRNQLTVLGEAGSGKSWYCRHLLYGHAKRYLDDPRSRRIPVLVTFRALTSSQDLLGFMAEQLTRAGARLGAGIGSLRYANEAGRLLLILDGLDELRWNLSLREANAMFNSIATLVGERSKVILTSRPGFFQSDAAGPPIITDRASGNLLIDVAGRANFEVIRLVELNYEQRVAALSRRLGDASGATLERINRDSTLTALARVPALLDMLATILPLRPQDEPTSSSELFKTYAYTMLDPSGEEHDSAARLFQGLRTLAWRMHSTGDNRLTADEARTLLEESVRTSPPGAAMTVDDARWDAFLYRDADGYIRFRLKSMSEFLTSDVVADHLRSGDWSVLAGSLLPSGVSRFVAEQLRRDAPKLLHFLETTAVLPVEAQGEVASNLVTLLNAQGESLAGCKLSGRRLRRADLRRADLEGADLEDADLEGALLQGAAVRGANLRGANLKGVVLQETRLVSAVAFSQSGGLLMGGSGDGVVHLYATEDWSESLAIPSQVGFRALSPVLQDRYILLGGLDGVVYRADLNTSQSFNEIAVHGASILCLAASREGLVVTGGADGRVCLWDAMTGDRLWSSTGSRDGYIRAIALTRDEGQVLVGRSNGILDLLAIQSGEALASWEVHRRAGVYGIVTLPGGQAIVTSSDDRSIRVWHADDGLEQLRLEGFGDTVLTLSVASKMGLLIAGCRDGQIQAFSLGDQDLQPVWAARHHAPILCSAVEPAGQWLATGSADGLLRIWRLADGQRVWDAVVGDVASPSWAGVDLRGVKGWAPEWIRYMAEKGAVIGDRDTASPMATAAPTAPTHSAQGDSATPRRA